MGRVDWTWRRAAYPATANEALRRRGRTEQEKFMAGQLNEAKVMGRKDCQPCVEFCRDLYDLIRSCDFGPTLWTVLESCVREILPCGRRMPRLSMRWT